MQMFGIGMLELMVILILAVIVVGPDRLPGSRPTWRAGSAGPGPTPTT